MANKVIENKGMVEIIEIEVDGVKFIQTRPGYYYKRQDGKQTRVSKAEWEQAFDQYMANKQDEEPVEQEQPKQAKKPAYEIKSLWDGDTTSYSLYIKGELEGRYWSYEEAEKVAKEKTKKAPRKSKDIAFEMNGVTLTTKQVKFIKLMPRDDFFENGLESTLWIDVFCETITDQFSPMAVGAMVSTLREKDIILIGQDKVNGKKAKWMKFTDLGKQVAKELGLD